jgi:hypothetical protein
MISSNTVARENLATMQNGEELLGTHPCNNKTQRVRKNESGYSASYYDQSPCNNFSCWIPLTLEEAVDYLWKMRKWFNESLRQQQEFERRISEAKEEVSKLDIPI